MPWTCQRTTAGVKCRERNDNRRRICIKCGKRRPPRQRPAHLSALSLPYSYYLALQGDVERCGICHAAPKPGRKLHRDHEHQGVGYPRGLLCFRCNAALRPYMGAAWLRAALTYVTRADERRAA
jgi:hypothetical protein